MSTEPTIPNNPEHIEAANVDRQAAINAERQSIKAKLSAEELTRLEVIEEVSGRLERAGVPFLLFASSDAKTPEGMPEGWRGWWQFNKMSYAEPYEVMREQAFYACQSMFSHLMKHQTLWLPGSIVVYDTENQPVYMFREGVRHDLRVPPSPPEL